MGNISRDIIEQAGQGDTEAFEIIYREYSGFVFTLARRVLENSQDAQEVTQDVFITLFHKLNDFRFDSSLKTWIYRISINTAINARNKRSRENQHLFDVR